MPVGLKNVGNSRNCMIFNEFQPAMWTPCCKHTLLITNLFKLYSHLILMWDFLMMTWKPIPRRLIVIENKFNSKGETDIKKIRFKVKMNFMVWKSQASISLIKHLQKLFAFMIRSHKKYVDPTEVLNSVVDDMGRNYSLIVIK